MQEPAPRHELPLRLRPARPPRRPQRAARGYADWGPKPFTLLDEASAGQQVVFPPGSPGGAYPPSRPTSTHGTLRSWLDKREGQLSARLGCAGTAVAGEPPVSARRRGCSEGRRPARNAGRARQPQGPQRRAAAAAETAPAAAAVLEPLRPYRWLPVQTYAHPQDGEKEYFLGTYVNTLSMNFELGPEARWEPLPLAPDGFRPLGALPQCCKLGGEVVFCRGQVVGCCPQEHDAEMGRKAWVARLPEGMRPRSALHFAALCEELPGAHGAADGHSTYSSHLVTLTVAPDGWIRGLGLRGTEATIDLSAVRFSTGRGIAIADTVRLQSIDIGSKRMLVLQGSLLERAFDEYAACDNHDVKPMLSFPQTCRPACDQPFVVPGLRAGGFHLIRTQPSQHFGFGGGLAWCDSVWQRDAVSLSGLLFEVAPEMAQLPMELQEWSPIRRHIVVKDFQKVLLRKYGSIEAAWSSAFDLDGSGSIDFSEFASACKAAGYVGNTTRLWAMLDEDCSGEISLEELSMVTSPTGPPQLDSILDA